MNPIRRHEMIMEVMLNQKDVTVNELSDKLQVTGKTIREDLSKLEEQGLIVRVHGGAVLAQSDQFGILPSKDPLDKYSDEKTEIALRALAHIDQDDIIALDGGSTTLEIARRLDNMPLTVVTNDVYIISELVPKDHIRLVVPGVTVSAICWPALKPSPMCNNLIFKKHFCPRQLFISNMDFLFIQEI